MNSGPFLITDCIFNYSFPKNFGTKISGPFFDLEINVNGCIQAVPSLKEVAQYLARCCYSRTVKDIMVRSESFEEVFLIFAKMIVLD